MLYSKMASGVYDSRREVEVIEGRGKVAGGGNYAGEEVTVEQVFERLAEVLCVDVDAIEDERVVRMQPLRPKYN